MHQDRVTHSTLKDPDERAIQRLIGAGGDLLANRTLLDGYIYGIGRAGVLLRYRASPATGVVREG